MMHWPYLEPPEKSPAASSASSEDALIDKICGLNLLDDSLGATSSATATSPRGHCAVCSSLCRMRCGGCNDVFYCSKKHQQTHWAKHKADCRPFSIPTQHGSTWKNPPKAQDAHNPSESRFMVSNKDIPGGKTLFSEKPLLICPNPPEQDCCLCFGCYGHFPLDRKKGAKGLLEGCKRCLLPLCLKCLEANESQGASSKYHDKEICTAVGDGVSKNRPLMLERNERLGQNVDLVKDYSLLKLLLLQKSDKSKWDAVMNLKGNCRYHGNLKNPTDFVKSWGEVEYSLADNYVKYSLKDKSVKLENIARIYATFSDVAFSNPCIRVLYELRSWVPHGCSPNSEFHFRLNDASHTLYLQSVDNIKPDNIITVNYMPDYEEGRSKNAIRLFNKSRMICALKNCACKAPGSDTSVGIRCNLFPPSKGDTSATSCTGCLAPALDPPNPDKPNLGMLIYIKSKNWNCSRCRKSEKFYTIQKIVKEVNDKVKEAVDSYCAAPDAQGYVKIKDILSRNLSEQHWLHWKANEATLKRWDSLVGNGQEMLQKAVAFPPGTQRHNFLSIVNLKAALYGNCMSSSTKNMSFLSNQGVLAMLEQRHGRMSLIRANYLFDAFYSSFVKFSEDFKYKLTQSLSSTTSSLPELITDTIGQWRSLLNMLQESSAGFQHRDTYPNLQKKYKVVKELHEILQDVYLSSFKNRNSVISYMQEYLEAYACQDPMFLGGTLAKFRSEPDPLARLFDPKGSHHLTLTFGQINSSSSSSGSLLPENVSTRMPIFKSSPTSPFGSTGSNPPTGPNRPGFAFSARTRSELKVSDSEESEEDDSDEFIFEDEDEDPYDVDLDDLFEVPMEYYEKLLAESVKQRMTTEKLLRDLMS